MHVDGHLKAIREASEAKNGLMICFHLIFL